MKRSSWVLLALTLTTASVAQDGGQNVYIVASRSAHETVWQRLEWETNEVGQTIAHTNAFVELATGLNYFDETTQAWQPSREEWEVYPEGIVARSGQNKVILATNLNLSGAVDVLTPNGVRLISSPVSLAFYDPVDGRHALLAEVKDCVAERGAAANEIVFRDCFDRIRGSIRYLYTKAGVHQHVVLEQKLELPEGFSERSRLECYTVFAPETPWPQIQTRVLRREKDPLVRALMVEPDFTDSELSFGSEMAMRAGKAFHLSDESDDLQARSIRVGKQFVEIEGLPVLIEGVEFKQLEPLLAGLASVGRPNTGGLAINSSRQIKRAKEQARLPREHFRAWEKGKEIQLASHPLSEPAVVIDYELLSSATNKVLAGGTTWYVSGLVYLSGTTRLEDCVIKFTNSTSARIHILGTLDCQTGPYRMAHFTSQYDTTVGEAIGSGTPTNYPAALVINTSSNVLHDLRFSYAASAVTLELSAGQIQLASVQFVKCQYPIDSAGEEENTIIIDNGLFFSSQYVIRGGEGLTVHGRHLTVNQCDRIGYTGFGSTTGDLYLTNSLVVAATNGWGQFEGAQGSVTTNSTAYFTNDPGGIFQTVGAGSHYLANSSSYRNAGTTSINASLLAALKKKTTYPPVEITTNFTASTTLLPQATRDTDVPDLGFHYDPLDFVVSGRTLTNSTLTLTNGVALGNYGASSIAGISIRKGGNLVSEGSPANLNRIVRYNTVQEQATTNWSAASVADCVNIVADSSPVPQASFRFTAWSLPGRGHYFRSYAPITTAFIFKDCEFGPGLFDSLSSIAITNCFLDRMHLLFYDDSQPINYYSYNNLFRGGSLSLYGTGAGSWQFKDNLFDQTAISQSGTITHGYNGYVTNSSRLTPNQSSDVVLTNNPIYQTSHLGRYYYPTNDGLLSRLINAGSRYATNVGLYHFTTTTNQVKEAGSTVEIGFHYVALNASNLPADTDGDGLADYFEDRNGNGTYEAGTDPFDWTDSDTDGDGLGDLQEYELSFNVLVNDPAQDYGNEQNSQFETTVAVVGNNVIVAWVDSNQGVYALGENGDLTNYTPRMVGYAVSRDGGVTFEDKGVPPLCTNNPTISSDDGDVGDPVLAVDRASGVVYLAGTSMRSATGHKGIPLWKSTDGGVTFNTPITVRADITQSDKPWIAVDDWPGTGQHDVYLMCTGKTNGSAPGLWLAVSKDGVGGSWTNPPLAARLTAGTDPTAVNSPIILVTSNHTAYAFWFESTGPSPYYTNWLKMRQVLNRGASLADVQPICRLVTTNTVNGNLELKRSNTASSNDTFRVFPFPVPAANPIKTNHLYVAYADKGTNANDKADIFFLQSTNGGATWTNLIRVNTDSTTNDQWMPVLCVKPDGTQVFMAWYDRRDDTNNSWINVYGRWGTIATNGNVSFGTEFKISTTNFPPVFPGTLLSNTNQGHYDPVYPPGGVNLNWWYPEWPLTNIAGLPVLTDDSFRGHVGEYNGTWASGDQLFVTWTDYRLPATGTLYARNQSDIRFVRLTWPQ